MGESKVTFSVNSGIGKPLVGPSPGNRRGFDQRLIVARVVSVGDTTIRELDLTVYGRGSLPARS